MSGSRDPYRTSREGAGLVLAWQGSPLLLINHENEDKEIAQILSDSMFIAIPQQVALCYGFSLLMS
jgi:hypothetical protein